MLLTLLERISILNILPSESDFITLKIVNNLKETLSPSEEEYKEFEIKREGDQIVWNLKGQEPKQIAIGEKATDIIIEELKKLNQEKKLNQNLFSVYEKFIN